MMTGPGSACRKANAPLTLTTAEMAGAFRLEPAAPGSIAVVAHACRSAPATLDITTEETERASRQRAVHWGSTWTHAPPPPSWKPGLQLPSATHTPAPPSWKVARHSPTDTHV